MNSKLKQAEDQLRQGNIQDALESFQLALQEDANQPDIWHVVAILQTRMGQFETALKAINQGIEHNPANPATFYNSKGNILMRLHHLEEAQACYEKTIELQPDYSIGYNSLGRCLYQQEKLMAAKNAYEKAIEYNASFSEAYFNLGVLLTKLGEHTQALQKLEQALQLTPHYPAALGQIAQIYLQQQEFNKVIQYLQKRLELEPNHLDSLYDLGLAYLETKQFELAVACFLQVTEKNPQHPEVNHSLATAFLQGGNRTEALHYYYRQLEHQPLVATYYNIGVLLMYEERHKEAINYLERAAELDPGYLPAHINLGALYLKIQHLQNAIKHYQLAAQIKPNDPEINHILTAISQTSTADAPAKAPGEYLQHLFDQYASFYDKHLTEYLHYKVPQELHRLIMDEMTMPINEAHWIILDMGCGTGLCGELFKEFASKLIGVDISAEMIEVARRKNIYTELKVADIFDALQEYQSLDLALAADVFTYIGDLAPIFAQLSKTLNPAGMFAFSVEKGNVYPYELRKTIRYAHSRKYLESLIKEYQFKTLRFENFILRKQKDGVIEGYLVVLQKEL